MYDCNDDVLAFHNEKVTLSQALRTQMRGHRDANRKRLKDRLKEEGFPLPKEFIKQGSYAMLTMVQNDDNDYDIDDGVYFAEDDLNDKDGNPLSPSAARQRVCDALQDQRFTKQPRVLRNCVRVYYNEGYHVDMPVYRFRKSDGEYELASGDEWTVSRAADVEDWFYDANVAKSPDKENGRQFRRIVRHVKKFGRSRVAWKEKIAVGFTITTLVEDCYVANADRDDAALRDTMRKVHDRLDGSLEVWHPTTPGNCLATDDDPKTTFLRDRLATALDDLAVLDQPDCTAKQAREAWNKVYDTDFFSTREKKEAMAASGVSILTNLLSKRENPRPVDKQGGGRFA